MVNKILRYAIHSPNCKLDNKMPGVIDLTDEIPEVYSNYKYNEHHWTTNYIWNTFIPRLSNDLSLQFNIKDYKKITHITDGNDLSYYMPITNETVVVNDMFYKTTDSIPISDTAYNKNYKSYLGCFTDYHKLFICAHRCAHISNRTSITKRNLLLNTDSMSVPVMPFLMHNFTNILILTRRPNSGIISTRNSTCPTAGNISRFN